MNHQPQKTTTTGGLHKSSRNPSPHATQQDTGKSPEWTNAARPAKLEPPRNLGSTCHRSRPSRNRRRQTQEKESGNVKVTIGVGDPQGRQFEDVEVTVNTGCNLHRSTPGTVAETGSAGRKVATLRNVRRENRPRRRRRDHHQVGADWSFPHRSYSRRRASPACWAWSAWSRPPWPSTPWQDG